MLQHFKKILIVIISIYISAFVCNFLWERFEINKINKILKKNYLGALDILKNQKKILGLNHYLILNHDDYNNHKKKFDKFNIYPLSTFSNKKIFLCNESGENVYIKTDKNGFRNKNENYIDPKIFLIGDSFGLGMCHSNKNFFVNKLPKKILNFSQGGTSTFIQSIVLREFAKFEKKSKLLWLFYLGNDLDELNHEVNNPYLRKYIDWKFTQNLSNKNVLKDNLLYQIANPLFENTKEIDIEKRFKLKKNDNFFKLIKLSFTRGMVTKKFFNLYSDKTINQYLEIVLGTKKNLNINDLTVVILPDSRVFTYKKYRELYKIDQIKQKLNSNGIKTIDLPKFFDEKYNFFDFFYSYSTHYKNEVNEIIANKINYCLNINQNLDCN